MTDGSRHSVVEVCAGAGGQSLGLELAGFSHELAVEIDPAACATLRYNRPGWKIAQGDVTSRAVWNPSRYRGVDLLAGGVPCQPFSVGGKQLGAADERDLLAWTVELAGHLRPRAVMVENVPGLSQARFAAYRQHVIDRLAGFGYIADWRLLNASDYGVPQLRPRFVLVAMQPEDFAHFSWPSPRGDPGTVGETLIDLMAANGWPGAAAWAGRAGSIAPTIVGGSKKHGGPDLGPSRAKQAWREMGVDPLGIADAAPPRSAPASLAPRLTCQCVSRLQGFGAGDYQWTFAGRKTAVYRQIGNAFPPPVARAVGEQILMALSRKQVARRHVLPSASIHDPVYAVLRADGGFLTIRQILARVGEPMDIAALERRLAHLGDDFTLETDYRRAGPAYRLGSLKEFTGKPDHQRHEEIRRAAARSLPPGRRASGPHCASEAHNRAG